MQWGNKGKDRVPRLTGHLSLTNSLDVMEQPEWPCLFLFFSIFFLYLFVLTVLFLSYFLTPSLDMDIGHIHKAHSIYRNYKPPTSLHPPYNYDGVAHVPLIGSQEGPRSDKLQCGEPSECCTDWPATFTQYDPSEQTNPGCDRLGNTRRKLALEIDPTSMELTWWSRAARA